MKRRIAAITLVVCALAGPSHAQDLLFLPGIQYGSPMRIAAGLTVFVPTSEPHLARRSGWLVEGSAGQGGARVAAGLANFLEYAGVDGRAVLTRTWTTPREASPDSTYGGIEAGLTIAYVRVSAGIAHRIAGVSGPDATVFTWTVGLHYPIGHDR